MNTLALVAHPNLTTKSIANKQIVESLEKTPNVSVRNLAQLYPDFRINVEEEQNALIEADLIIMQFPIHWYSCPGILKEWMDKVLTYGFAYGTEGTSLHGKKLLLSITVGGAEESYTPEGSNGNTLDNFLSPLTQMANFCGMQWISPLVTHDMVFIPNVWNTREGVEARAEAHVDRLLSQIQHLSTQYKETV